jgi:hypothetical protein
LIQWINFPTNDGVGSRIDGGADLGEVRGHGVGVAAGHDEAGALALLRADRPEDVGGLRALVVRGRGARAALGPAAGDLVLLADARLIGEPQLYPGAGRERVADLRQAGGEVFLKAAIRSSCLAHDGAAGPTASSSRAP